MNNDKNFHARNKKRSTIILLVILLLFLTPLLTAYVMFNGHYLIGRLLNHGNLVKPPFSVSLLPLRNERGELLNERIQNTKKKWMLIYFNPGLCDTHCRIGLANLQRIRKATGKNSERVERVLLTYPSNEPNNIAIRLIILERFPGTRHLTTKEKPFTDVIRKHIQKNYALQAGTIYLIDPLGNVIMTYQPQTKPNHIFKDLNRLLRASKIG